MKVWGVTLGWLTVMASLLVAVFVIKQPALNNDILALLPQSEPRLQQLETHFFASNKQQLSFSFSGENKEQAYDEMVAWLAKKNITPRFSVPKVEQLATFYSQYAGNLLTPSYQHALTDASRFQHYYFSQLSKVADPFVSSTINLDPSLSTAEFLTSVITQLQQFEMSDGRISIRHLDNDYLMLFVHAADNAFSIDQAVALNDDVLAQLAQLHTNYPHTSIHYSGALFHTAENAQQAKFEMTLFGTLSLIALIIMVVWVFRSFNALWLASVTVISAALGGSIALAIFFAEIHVLTLVFAVTLIGIAIDYAFHSMLDLTTHKNGFSRGLKLALLLSLVTTTLGYASLFFSPVQLLTQVGVFVVAGLITAWLTTRLLLPSWQARLTISVEAGKFAEKLSALLKSIHRQKVAIILLLLVSLSVFSLLKPPVLNDDVKLLNASPQVLMNNEALHMSLLGKDNGQIMIMFAENAEQLLLKQEALKVKIKQQGGQALMLSDLVPSAGTQQKNNNEMRVHHASLDVVTQLTGSPLVLSDSILTLDAALDSPLGPLIANQVILNNEFAASWFMVTGIDKTQLAEWARVESELLVYDKVAMITAGLEDYSHSLLVTIAIAITFAMLLFTFKFGFKVAYQQGLILGLTLAAVLLLCSAIQTQLSIFNLLGCLLILALAIDYLVFYQINKLTPSNVLAISLSAASSMWVFGMLAVSKTPAIFSFGLTVLVGLICIYLLAPLCVALPNNKEK